MFNSKFWFKCRLLTVSFSLLYAGHAYGQHYNIMNYGAVKDDTTKLSTTAINKAVAACAKNGGGQVIIPTGNFKSGTITLLSNVELYLERGAILWGSTNTHDYPRQQQPTYRSQKDQGGWYALIYAVGTSNIGISGFGTIDGQGARQVPQHPAPGGIADLDGRPRNILFISCKDVSVQNVSMRNSGIWNQHYLNCEDVIVNNIRVYNHSNQNNDGIDIDGCRRFILSNSILDSDDDCITLKSTGLAACENITITNCIASSFCNAIKCGTESTGGFRNIAINNCVVKPSRCKTEPVFKTPRIGQTGIALEIVDGGVMEGVNVNNVVIEGTECPIFVRLGNRARKHIQEAPQPGFGTMRNVSIANVTAYNTGNFGSSITGVPGAKIENIRLDNIRLVNKGGLGTDQYTADFTHVTEKEKDYPDPTDWGNLPSYGLFIRHVNAISLNQINLSSLATEVRVPILAVDVDSLLISNLTTNRPVAKQVEQHEVKKYNRL
jgi:polygalacturonase